MEEKAYLSILAVSANIADKSRVEILREHSKEIANEILKRKEGVFIIVGVREAEKQQFWLNFSNMKKNLYS